MDNDNWDGIPAPELYDIAISALGSVYCSWWDGVIAESGVDTPDEGVYEAGPDWSLEVRVIDPDEDDDEGFSFTFNAERLHAAIRELAASRPPGPGLGAKCQVLATPYWETVTSDIDAFDADRVLQQCVFGAARFG